MGVSRVRQEDELSELERLSLINMSFSRLDSYEMCPAKYFYTYIAKEERTFGPAATLGNILHSVLEDHVGGDLKFEVLVDSMKEHREAYDPDHKIEQPLIDVGVEMLAEFVDNHVDDKFDIIGKELPFEIIVGTARIRGFIDLVIRDPDGRIHIIDYKSGRHEITFKNTPTSLQLGIYALATNFLFPEESAIYAELYYLRSGRRKGHLFTQADMETTYDRVLGQVNTIIEDVNFRFTDNPQPCSFCDFRKTGVCKTGVRRFGSY